VPSTPSPHELFLTAADKTKTMTTTTTMTPTLLLLLLLIGGQEYSMAAAMSMQQRQQQQSRCFQAQTPSCSTDSLQGGDATSAHRKALSRTSSMRSKLCDLPAMDSFEHNEHRDASASAAPELKRSTRTLGVLRSCAGAHSLRRAESRPNFAYRARDADVVHIKTSLYPHMDFSEGE